MLVFANIISCPSLAIFQKYLEIEQKYFFDNSCIADATIIWGVQLDDTMEDEMRITVIATGLDETTATVASVDEVKKAKEEHKKQFPA